MPAGDPRPGRVRSLHWSSLIFGLGGLARAYLVPGLLVLFFSKGARTEAFFMVLFAPAAVFAVIRYLSFSYRFGAEELVVRSGVFTRSERHVPYRRIENVDLVQSVLQRLLGVAEVRIETASGKEPEAVLKVVDLAAVEEIRGQIFSGRSEAGRADAEGAERGDEESVPVHRLGAGDLAVLGLLSNRGLAIAAALWGLLYQAQIDLDRHLETFLREHAGPVTDWIDRVGREDLLVQALVGAALLVLAFLVLKLLSMVWAVLRFGGFTLRRKGEDLQISFGLLTRLSATVPRRRIQVLGIREGLFERRLDRIELRAQTAGGADEDREGGSRAFLAPIARKRDLPRLLAEIQPETRIEDLDWRPVAPAAARRLFRIRSFGLAALIAAAASLTETLWLFALVPAGLWAFLWSRGQIRNHAWAISDGLLGVRRGWITRNTGLVRFSRIQSVLYSASPFDRRWGMASVLVDTAGTGGAGVTTRIDWLPEEEARALARRLHREAAERPFVWG